jgi:outer membrane protein, adhesin transport system
MSNSTHIARTVRREEQLINDVSRRRPLFSALSVLVGTGVVALSAMPLSAEANSALDEMAWLPANTQLSNDAASVLNATKALGTRTIKVTLTDRDGSVSDAAALPAPRVEASAPAQPVAKAIQTSRGFADAGLVGVAEQAPQQTRNAASAVVSETRAQPVQRAAVVADASRGAISAVPAQEPNQARIGVAALPMRQLDIPAAASKPRETQAEFRAVRNVVETGPAALADEEQAAALRSAQDHLAAPTSMQPVRAAITKPDASLAASNEQLKSPRKGRLADSGYADWLDDAAGAKAQVDRTVVPEQAVRAALRSASELAAERSASVRQARNDWEAAKFDVDQVKGQRWPQVQMSGNSPSLSGSGGNRFDDTNRPSAAVNVTTVVYDWGKIGKSIDSRTKTAEAAELYFKTIEQQNAYEVSSNLVELAKNRAIYKVGQSYVKRMSALVDMLGEIVKADPGRLSELSQAKARLLQAQTSQEVVAAQVRSLELSVRKLVGDQATPMPAGTRWQLRLDGLDDAVAAVAQNPAIEQAMAETAAANATAKSVRAGSFPQLNWVINKTTAQDTFGQRQPWTTMLQLTWTPFQGGSQRAAERAALSRAASSRDKGEQLQLDSEFKVRDAHRDAIALATRAKLYADLSGETDVVRKQFFEQWYHLNRRTLVDVLSAESDFYNNQVSEVTTQFDAYQAILKIHLNNGTLDQWLQQA